MLPCMSHSLAMAGEDVLIMTGLKTTFLYIFSTSGALMHLCDHQCEDKLVNNSDVVIKDMNKKWAFSSYKCFYSNLFQQQEQHVRFI